MVNGGYRSIRSSPARIGKPGTSNNGSITGGGATYESHDTPYDLDDDDHGGSDLP